jgi:hypothetical protein
MHLDLSFQPLNQQQDVVVNHLQLLVNAVNALNTNITRMRDDVNDM